MKVPFPFAFHGHITAALIRQKVANHGVLAHNNLYISFPSFMKEGDEATFVARHDVFVRDTIRRNTLTFHLRIDIIPGHIVIPEEYRIEIEEVAGYISAHFYDDCQEAAELILELANPIDRRGELISALREQLSEISAKIENLD